MVKLNRFFFESLLEGLYAEQGFHGTVWKKGGKVLSNKPKMMLQRAYLE